MSFTSPNLYVKLNWCGNTIGTQPNQWKVTTNDGRVAYSNQFNVKVVCSDIVAKQVEDVSQTPVTNYVYIVPAVIVTESKFDPNNYYT